MSNLYIKFLSSVEMFKAFLKKDIKYRILKDISEEQWLTVEELEKIQVERFNKLWKNTYTHSTFYKSIYETKNLPKQINSIDDLSLFPLLKRSDLQNYGQEILSTQDKTLYADSSGGSSGVPVNFYHDNYYYMYGEALYSLFLSWLDINHFDKTAIFWGADRDHKELSFKEKLSLRIKRIKMFNSFNVEEKTLDKFLEELEEFKPTFIYGYASSLELAAKRINNLNKYTIRPKVIRSTAEMLYDFQREEIEKAFKCPVANFYGSREVNNIAAECSAHEGMHVFSSGRILEIVDEGGRPLPNDEIGYIAITDLTNFTFPFIRYINGDMASWNDKPCSCGRSYPLLKNIVGRESDILTFGNKFIHSEFFAHLFYQQPKVRQFQIIQESDSELVIKLAAPKDEVNTLDIKEKIWNIAGRNLTIDFEYVDEIKSLQSGKYRFTINNSKNKTDTSK